MTRDPLGDFIWNDPLVAKFNIVRILFNHFVPLEENNGMDVKICNIYYHTMEKSNN